MCKGLAQILAQVLEVNDAKAISIINNLYFFKSSWQVLLLIYCSVLTCKFNVIYKEFHKYI